MAPAGTTVLLKRALENLRISGPRTLLLASSINPSSSQPLPKMYLTTCNMSRAIPNSQTGRQNNMWIIYKILKIKMHETEKQKNKSNL